jgi:serine O-acetyltransferase
LNKKFIERLLKARHDLPEYFPDMERVHQFADDVIEVLFPHFSGEIEYFSDNELEGKFRLLERDLKKILSPQKKDIPKSVDMVVQTFFDKIPDIYQSLLMDAQAILEGDPASESIEEVISAYPGFFAIYCYRIAHVFYQESVPIFPRLLTEYAHFKTGIDIHPGAQIGKSFFIDHGTGIVIGETTVIGNNVKIYQGVTLGALSVSKKLSQTKRHPTIEDNVVIYASAAILGGETVIGHDSVIGGNVWLIESVPPYSMVSHRSDIKVHPKKKNSD